MTGGTSLSPALVPVQIDRVNPLISSAEKTVENSGVKSFSDGYTYYRAEESTGIAPMAGTILIVEPGGESVGKIACSSSACEAEEQAATRAVVRAYYHRASSDVMLRGCAGRGAV
jgi:hypothetical protein